jgi:hypothetical protein
VLNSLVSTMSRKSRRLVEVSDLVPPRRAVRLWAFGYADLASFFGMKEDALRQAVKRHAVDPSNLASVLAFKHARNAEDPAAPELLAAS